MKVSGTQTQTTRVEVDVDPKDIARQLIHFILRAHGFPLNAFVNDKSQIAFEYEEHGGSHSWFTEKVINEHPTTEQLEIFACLRALAKQLDIAIQLNRNTK